jgi:hypothetical protein
LTNTYRSCVGSKRRRRAVRSLATGPAPAVLPPVRAMPPGSTLNKVIPLEDSQVSGVFLRQLDGLCAPTSEAWVGCRLRNRGHRERRKPGAPGPAQIRGPLLRNLSSRKTANTKLCGLARPPPGSIEAVTNCETSSGPVQIATNMFPPITADRTSFPGPSPRSASCRSRDRHTPRRRTNYTRCHEGDRTVNTPGQDMDSSSPQPGCSRKGTASNTKQGSSLGNRNRGRNRSRSQEKRRQSQLWRGLGISRIADRSADRGAHLRSLA